jgi:hypothetical protein
MDSRGYWRFIVRGYGGQALACVYYEKEPGRRSATNCPRETLAYNCGLE